MVLGLVLISVRLARSAVDHSRAPIMQQQSSISGLMHICQGGRIGTRLMTASFTPPLFPVNTACQSKLGFLTCPLIADTQTTRDVFSIKVLNLAFMFDLQSSALYHRVEQRAGRSHLLGQTYRRLALAIYISATLSSLSMNPACAL